MIPSLSYDQLIKYGTTRDVVLLPGYKLFKTDRSGVSRYIKHDGNDMVAALN